MKKLAIIGAGNMAKIFSQNAHNLDIEVHCFAWDKGAVAKNFVDYFYPISIFDTDLIVQKCREQGINGVVATTELTIFIAAYVAKVLGLNGLDLTVAKVITDKYRNRVVSRGGELCHPRFMKVSSPEDVYNSGFSYPLILKPVNLGGKRGVTIIDNTDDVRVAFKFSREDSGGDTQLLLEEYVGGNREFSVESLTVRGVHHIIQVTEKINSGPPHFVELGHMQPAKLSKNERSRIELVVKEALQKIGINFGACHTEIKIYDGKIYLIEFNARCGGDCISYPLVNLSTGYNYIQGVIRAVIGEEEEIDETKFEKYNAGIFLVTKQTEYLKGLFEECERFDWCYYKHEVSRECCELKHNDISNTNYFIWRTEGDRPNFEKLISGHR